MNLSVQFKKGEWKCNLFVYEVLLEAGCHIKTINRYPNYREDLWIGPGGARIYPFEDNHRPPCCIDWYNKEVLEADFIGEGIDGIEDCEKGDIITDGNHIGIVAGRGKSINAGEMKVNLNEFGFGEEKWSVRIFRCDNN